MATKKQKRAAAEAKHEAFMEEYRESGLKALKKDRARRVKKNLQLWEDKHNADHNWKNRPKDCPHCEIIRKASDWNNRKVLKANREKAAG